MAVLIVLVQIAAQSTNLVPVSRANAADGALVCAPGTIYSLGSAGELVELRTADSGVTSTSLGTWNKSVANSLGISKGGAAAYALQRATGNSTSVTILKYTQAEGFTTYGSVEGVDRGVTAGAIAGAVDPVTGRYLFAGWDTSGRFHLYGVDVDAESTQTRAIDYGYFSNPEAQSTNGDFAFDKQGNLYVVLSPGGTSVTNHLYVITSGALASANGNQLTATQIAAQSGQNGNFNGVAFDSTGKLFTQTTSGGNSIQQVNPNTMTAYAGSQSSINVASPVDLGSCLYPGTITVQKNFVQTADFQNGRYDAGDQAQLAVQRQSDAPVTATTSGNTPGLQTEQVGPIIGVSGEKYTISEAGAAGLNLSDHYTSTYDLSVNGTAQTSAAPGTSTELLSFPQPSGDSGPDYAYTFNNTPVSDAVPGYELSKSSDPVSGSQVHPGDTVTYTVTGANTGETVLDPVVVTDDLSQVLPFADVQGEPVAKIGDQVVAAPTVDQDAKTLSWTGSLQPGESVVITYQVKVTDQAVGKTLVNVAASEATPPGQPPIVPEKPSTNNPVPTPGFTFTKTSDASAISTPAKAGQQIVYHFEVSNTGETVLTNVHIDDPLPGLGEIQYQWPAASGVLQPGEKVTASATYAITETDIQAGEVNNSALAYGTPPGGSEVPSNPGKTHDPLTPPSELSPLAKTGTEAGALFGGAGLLALGAMLIEIARRRRGSSARH